MARSLSGETAIITGAGQGIGRSIAIKFAEKGANIVCVDKNSKTASSVAEEIHPLGVNSIPLSADVSNAEEVSFVVQRTIQAFGRVDILVNNAGATSGTCSLEDLLEEDWDKVVNTNLRGSFLFCKTVGKKMIERRKGIIINIASVAGHIPYTHSGAYGPSKAAVIALTKQLSLEWARYNIRVNAISPGSIRTPLTEPIYADEELGEARRKTVPLGRVGAPQDIANVAYFLASKESSFITGVTLSVDGGLLESLFLRHPGRT
ncbi:MAG: hypothetical protein A2157_04445 [Deltaproteobacteria bacterium RBG_16_47_11]|nr:MAG: hypothetical protein A2157_04445 [Deltaproteobacteria bacterium RBG_16_47_11]